MSRVRRGGNLLPCNPKRAACLACPLLTCMPACVSWLCTLCCIRRGMALARSPWHWHGHHGIGIHPAQPSPPPILADACASQAGCCSDTVGAWPPAPLPPPLPSPASSSPCKVGLLAPALQALAARCALAVGVARQRKHEWVDEGRARHKHVISALRRHRQRGRDE